MLSKYNATPFFQKCSDILLKLFCKIALIFFLSNLVIRPFFQLCLYPYPCLFITPQRVLSETLGTSVMTNMLQVYISNIIFKEFSVPDNHSFLLNFKIWLPSSLIHLVFLIYGNCFSWMSI